MSPSPQPLADPYPAVAKTSGLAIASLVSSVLGFLCIPALGGLLGLVLGVAARSEIQRDGRGGSGIAWAGIGLGAVNVLGSAVALAALLVWMPQAFAGGTPTPAPRPPAPRFGPSPHFPPAPPTFPAPPSTVAPAPSPSAAASRAQGTVITEVGAITLVDVDRDSGSLSAILEDQRALAQNNGQKLVLWTVAPDCQPCNGVATSLSDARMQQALAKVRLVRVDIRDFLLELSYLDMPSDKIPGFALVGAANRPRDYVHGGEWDEDIARNIAPVLGPFVAGTYTKRRDPWQPKRRSDETTL